MTIKSDIKKCMAPSLKLYEYLLENPEGLLCELESKFADENEGLSTAYRLGFISCGLDGNQGKRYKITPKGEEHAIVNAVMSLYV